MIPAIIALSLTTLAVTVAFVVTYRQVRRDRPLPAVGETVIVTTKRPDEQSLHGIVRHVGRHGILLTGTRLLLPDGDSVAFTPADVMVTDWSFVQRRASPIYDVVDQAPAPPPLPANEPMRATRKLQGLDS